MERSIQEKEILAQIVKESEPLGFPLKRVSAEGFEDELVYEIPEDKKLEVLKELWPFVDTPDGDRVFLDIHSGKEVVFKECLVVRSNLRNLIVSPYYFESGGMVVDLISPDSNVCARALR